MTNRLGLTALTQCQPNDAQVALCIVLINYPFHGSGSLWITIWNSLMMGTTESVMLLNTNE